MKKIILTAIFALSAIAFMPTSIKAQIRSNNNISARQPTNALAAWSEGYQYGMSHGWGQEDSLYWAHVQMQIWINNHS
jgi:hypothetical protein